MLSVITPVRDIISEGRLPFFRKMFSTLYSQTYRDFEHIVVDAASNDGTLEILKEYQEKGQINVLISEPDRNVHEAMNKGLRKVKGDVIHVMNSDNYFTTNRFFERSLEALEKYGADFTHADRTIVHRNGSPTSIKRGDEKIAFFRMPFRYQTMLIRKSVYDEIGLFDERFVMAADLQFMMRMLLSGKKGVYFPETFICSLDGGNTRDRQKCIDEVTVVLFEEYGEKYGLTIEDCRQIYLRKITPELFSKIQLQVKKDRIRESLEYCYYHTTALNDVPLEQNYTNGLNMIEIPELGSPSRGKVRDNWTIGKGEDSFRLMVATDRLAVNAHPICLIPGKGQIANLMSAYWFERTRDIIPNHMIAVPHPNILLARKAKSVIPVEVVVRRYLARSSNPSSIFYNYFVKGRRDINGIPFPEGLQPNQELPMGTIITPTTKARNGYDEELTAGQARFIADEIGGKGAWDRINTAALQIFERARLHCAEKGLILADTKFEFGVDEKGDLMLVDETLTTECSRYWLSKTYTEKVKQALDPDPPKNAIIQYIEKHGFTWKGDVPPIPNDVIAATHESYAQPYRMIMGKDLPAPTTDYREVALAALNAIHSLHSESQRIPKYASM